jgi:hypothetical protein
MPAILVRLLSLSLYAEPILHRPARQIVLLYFSAISAATPQKKVLHLLNEQPAPTVGARELALSSRRLKGEFFVIPFSIKVYVRVLGKLAPFDAAQDKLVLSN